MMLKASLHIHTFEDKLEGHLIKYNFYELIDWASQLGFNVLGLTCHKKFVYQDDYAAYAASKGILFLPGIELQMKKVKRNDLVVLNIDPKEAKEIEKINSFKKLSEYKKKHPEIFTLAAHPLADRRFSMGRRKLVKNMDLFDSVEHVWFYSRRLFNPNKKAEKIIAKFNKPFLATSDAHFLKYFNTDYVLVEADALEAASFFSAIKRGRFINVTRPKKIHQLLWCVINFQLKKIIFFVKKHQHNKISKSWI